MSSSRAVFLDLASIHPDDLDLSPLDGLADWTWRDNTHSHQVADVIAGHEILVTNKVVLDETVLSSSDSLKLVCTAATGVNNIDVAACQRLGIQVCNARAYATPAVVQHVFALLLSLTTRLQEYMGDVQQGRWGESEFFCLLDHPIRELSGKTLGIVGYGELGKSVADVARAFGMTVLVAKRDASDERKDRLDLSELLPRVDVLSLHIPLNDSTRGLIGRDQLALMKNDAVLVNTARGGLVDEQALYEALRDGELGGAGIDVLEQEPPHADSVLVANPLPNLLLTPHTAWASREARQRVINELMLNIRAYRQGRSRNLVSA